MNKFTVTLEIETYSDDPEDWIIDSISENLEDDEQLDHLQLVIPIQFLLPHM